MRTGTKVFLGFIAGASVASVGTAVCCKKYYEKQIREEIIPSIREDYDERISALEKEMEKRRKEREKRAKELSKQAKAREEAQKVLKQYASTGEVEVNGAVLKKGSDGKVKIDKKPSKGDVKLDTNKTDYTKSYKEGNTDKHVKLEPKKKTERLNGLKIDEQGHVYSKAASKGHPYIITMDEFGEMNGYEKSVYTYWTYDEVFTDETEDPDLNIVMYLGHDLMDLWPEYAEDDELYIRNDEQMTDYDIVIRDRSYADYMREPDFDE